MLGMRSPVTSFVTELPNESAVDETLEVSMIGGTFEVVGARYASHHCSVYNVCEDKLRKQEPCRGLRLFVEN